MEKLRRWSYIQTTWDFTGSPDMWSTSVGGHLMKVVNLTGFTVLVCNEGILVLPRFKLIKLVLLYLDFRYVPITGKHGETFKSGFN